MKDYQYTVLKRFTDYVKIDTQSDPESKSSPSTEKQKDLGRVLVKELLQMGIQDAHLDEYGYVYATIPSNSEKSNVPTICFCSHMDTSPDASGQNVKPLIHSNYQGKDIVLPDDNSIVLRMSDHEDLKNQIGNDIVTASGKTLLGADNKAGVAEIMDAAHFLMTHPEVKHGDIRILFTPDEEIGRGTENVNIEKLAAEFGYTIDGENAGALENETFSADSAEIFIKGIATHPGFAKGKMVNAIKVAASIVDSFPKMVCSPETTDEKEPFIHPTAISGHLEEAKINLILRDFDTEGLKDLSMLIQEKIEEVLEEYPGATAELKIHEQYRNMKEVLDRYPHVTDYALEAIKRAGLTPKLTSIRGGTDGSRLSFMGLPCPNIFAGEHAFHSKQEWVSVQDMQKAVDVIVHLSNIWEEKA
jgi:tripeptide aminopeptidase